MWVALYHRLKARMEQKNWREEKASRPQGALLELVNFPAAVSYGCQALASSAFGCPLEPAALREGSFRSSAMDGIASSAHSNSESCSFMDQAATSLWPEDSHGGTI